MWIRPLTLRDFSVRSKLANSVDPDETARGEPSHLDLHCLHMYICFDLPSEMVNMPGLNSTDFFTVLKQKGLGLMRFVVYCFLWSVQLWPGRNHHSPTCCFLLHWLQIAVQPSTL